MVVATVLRSLHTPFEVLNALSYSCLLVTVATDATPHLWLCLNVQGGSFTDTPIPPDAKFTTLTSADVTQTRPAANPSLIKEPTDSYSPGGPTPPGTHGSKHQITLLSGGSSGDFATASSDSDFEYEPMGPTSRGGVRGG